MSKSSSGRKEKSSMSEYSSGLDAGSLVPTKKRKVASNPPGTKKKGQKGKIKKK